MPSVEQPRITRHDTAETLNLLDTILNEIKRGEPELSPEVMGALQMQDMYTRDIALASQEDRQVIITTFELYKSNNTELVNQANEARRRAMGRLVLAELHS